MSQLTLYTAEICPYAQRTRIVLHEKAIEHELVEIDLDDKPDWLADLTPTNRVPVIRHDDFVLWESQTVNEYLDGSFSGVALQPADERGRAVMRNEIRHFDSVFLPALYKLLFEQDQAVQVELRAQVTEGFEFLEQRLATIQGDGPFWLGGDMSLADASMWPFFERLGVFEHYRDLVLPSTCLRLHRWFEAVAEYTSVQSTAHDLEYFLPRYTHYANGTADGLSAQAFRRGTAN
ncbi:MAG: glutathione S-transferase family protein [Gammaproteobacteria bacterium]